MPRWDEANSEWVGSRSIVVVAMDIAAVVDRWTDAGRIGSHGQGRFGQ